MEFWLIPLVSYGVFIFSVALLASFGASMGVRRTWIKVLLYLFEWGKSCEEEEEMKNYDDSAEIIKRDIVLKTDGIYFRAISVSESADKEGQAKPESESNDLGAETQGQSQLESNTKYSENISPLADSLYFAKNGIEAIIQDQVTGRFSAEKLGSWNLLTRTNRRPQYITWKLSVVWFFGCVVRYIVLFPFRLSLCVLGLASLALGSILVSRLEAGPRRKWVTRQLNLTCARIIARSFSAVLRFHNKQHKAKGGGICVANHTSPLDVILLHCDNNYAMVGQSHSGFLGFLQRAVSKAEHHIWFERGESRDRLAVSHTLKNHVTDSNRLPVLIFPEGTCINNTSIMMFKKGSFEIDTTIYPVAMKYDSRFADAFWNSSKFSMLRHLFLIMTSWALVCDIWYLPPEIRNEGETAQDFAGRIKAKIASQGGLVDLDWDGGLKRARPKDTYREKVQELYSKREIKVE